MEGNLMRRIRKKDIHKYKQVINLMDFSLTKQSRSKIDCNMLQHAPTCFIIKYTYNILITNYSESNIILRQRVWHTLCAIFYIFC